MPDLMDGITEMEPDRIDAAIAAQVRRAAALQAGDVIEHDGQRLCESCHEPIPAPRLLAQPAAVRCVECQSEFEARKAHG